MAQELKVIADFDDFMLCLIHYKNPSAQSAKSADKEFNPQITQISQI